MPGLSIKVAKDTNNPDIAVIKLHGFLDSNTSSDFEHAIRKLVYDKIFKIIINLNGIDYISSAGWGIFVSEIKSIRENAGDLKLVGMIPDVFEIFKLLEFDEIFQIFDSESDAIKKFKES